jgi:hypothetical protein
MKGVDNMWKKIKKFLQHFQPLNTAWYSRPTFVFTFLNGEKEEYTPKLFTIYADEKPSESWRFFEKDGVICGKYPVSAMRMIETKDWEHIRIQWYGSSFRVFEFPKWETKERLMSEHIPTLYDYYIT